MREEAGRTMGERKETRKYKEAQKRVSRKETKKVRVRRDEESNHLLAVTVMVLLWRSVLARWEALGDPRRGSGSGRLPKTLGYCFSAAVMIRAETTRFSRHLPTSLHLHEEPGLALT